MKQIHIWPEEKVEANDWVSTSAVIEIPERNRWLLWYRIPIQYGDYLTERCDSFLIATIFLAMKRAANVTVHGEVSPLLLRNLTEFQAAWSSWCPQQYRPVEIRADVEKEAPNLQENRAIAAFSGGVDSSFTIWRHRTKRCGRLTENLQAGLMIHGLDIPLNRQEVFEQAAVRGSKMLSSLGVELIPLATNFRQLPLKWEDAFGTGIVSCLMLLQGGYSKGIIASSFPYHALSFPYGSNPVTDWLLSSSAFQMVHDGAEFNRIEKIRELVSWQEALQYLRVCWQGPDLDRNCGRCEKCARTILIFRLVGGGLPPCFERDLSNNQIRDIWVQEGPLTEMERVLEAAIQAEIDESWVQSLKQCVRRNQRIEFLKKRLPVAWKDRLRRLKK